MPSATIFGCTGAIGSNILTTLLADPAFSAITTISRRLPAAATGDEKNSKLTATQDANTDNWSPWLSALQPRPDVVFNAVGTTRAAAGGIDKQWPIDHDLPIATAKAAKAAGIGTFVFISSAGTRGLLSKFVPYSKMKIGVEDAVKECEFEQAIILRPGMILGPRETPKAPFFEAAVDGLGSISGALRDRIGKT